MEKTWNVFHHKYEDTTWSFYLPPYYTSDLTFSYCVFDWGNNWNA